MGDRDQPRRHSLATGHDGPDQNDLGFARHRQLELDHRIGRRTGTGLDEQPGCRNVKDDARVATLTHPQRTSHPSPGTFCPPPVHTAGTLYPPPVHAAPRWPCEPAPSLGKSASRANHLSFVAARIDTDWCRWNRGCKPARGRFGRIAVFGAEIGGDRARPLALHAGRDRLQAAPDATGIPAALPERPAGRRRSTCGSER